MRLLKAQCKIDTIQMISQTATNPAHSMQASRYSQSTFLFLQKKPTQNDFQTVLAHLQFVINTRVPMDCGNISLGATENVFRLCTFPVAMATQSFQPCVENGVYLSIGPELGFPTRRFGIPRPNSILSSII